MKKKDGSRDLMDDMKNKMNKTQETVCEETGRGGSNC